MLKKFLVLLVLISMSPVIAEDIDGSFEFDSRERTYTLHVPASYSAEDSVALIVNLHGGNGNAAQQISLSQMNVKADEENFLVVYPNGTTLPVGYTGWNAGEWSGSDVDDIGFIGALIDTVVANYNVDTLRVFATGFSLGAMMCHTLACELSTRIAAIAPVEGGLTIDDWNSCQPERLIPIMHFHHRLDETVPYYGDPTKLWAPPIDSVMEHWAQTNGCDIGPDTFYNDSGALRQTWTREDDSCEVVFWTLETGNGHAWPGTFLGTKELIANDEMWEFFENHPIPIEDEEPGIGESTQRISFEIGPVKSIICGRSASINFALDHSEHVTLTVYDPLGREIAILVDEQLNPGDHCIAIDKCNYPGRLLFYRLRTPTLNQTGKLVLID